MKLKTRLVILAIMWALTIALAMLVANTNSYMSLSAGSITAFAVEDKDKQPATGAGSVSFKTMTVAVCEKTGSESVYCHDEVKVVCGNESYTLPKETGKAACGELKVNTPPITAFAVFEKDWKDPRAS